MNREEISDAIKTMREQWCSVRAARLGRKETLVMGGSEPAAVRSDREYRRLKKEQRRLSTALRHLEMKLGRMRARDGQEER